MELTVKKSNCFLFFFFPENHLKCESLKHLDDCKFKISPLQGKHNLHNKDFKTVYHCDCTSRWDNSTLTCIILHLHSVNIFMQKLWNIYTAKTFLLQCITNINNIFLTYLYCLELNTNTFVTISAFLVMTSQMVSLWPTYLIF